MLVILENCIDMNTVISYHMGPLGVTRRSCEHLLSATWSQKICHIYWMNLCSILPYTFKGRLIVKVWKLLVGKTLIAFTPLIGAASWHCHLVAEKFHGVCLTHTQNCRLRLIRNPIYEKNAWQPTYQYDWLFKEIKLDH